MLCLCNNSMKSELSIKWKKSHSQIECHFENFRAAGPLNQQGDHLHVVAPWKTLLVICWYANRCLPRLCKKFCGEETSPFGTDWVGKFLLRLTLGKMDLQGERRSAYKCKGCKTSQDGLNWGTVSYGDAKKKWAADKERGKIKKKEGHHRPIR